MISSISESLTDLVNAVLKCPDWDPATLSSPLKNFYPKVKILGEEVPFSRTKPLSINIPETSPAKADVFLNDIVEAGIDTPPIRAKLQGAVALAVDAMSRRLFPTSDYPGDDDISERKVNTVYVGGHVREITSSHVRT